MEFFKLLYVRQPRGIIKLVWETTEEEEPRGTGVVQYILQLQEKLKTLRAFTKENLLKAHEYQAQAYNRDTRPHKFQPSNRVLLLLSSSESKLMAR